VCVMNLSGWSETSFRVIFTLTYYYKKNSCRDNKQMLQWTVTVIVMWSYHDIYFLGSWVYKFQFKYYFIYIWIKKYMFNFLIKKKKYELWNKLQINDCFFITTVGFRQSEQNWGKGSFGLPMA